MNLKQISQKHGSDAGGGDKCVRHNYCTKYDVHFNKFRNKKFNLLEIGIAGGRSLRAWKDYFPHANIVGVDIKDCAHSKENRIAIEQGDQKDTKFLCDLEKKHGPFEIIIDDGSHFWGDVIVSFIFLFPLLKQGGIYVIEDLHSSYSENCSKGYALSPIEYLKNSIDKLNMFGRYTDEKTGLFARATDKQKTVLEKKNVSN